MNFEVKSRGGNSLLTHKYTHEWELNNLSATDGKTFRTPAFCPVDSVDLKFCFEILFAKNISFIENNKTYSLFRLTLIKLLSSNIPQNMQVEIIVEVYYPGGGLFQECKSSIDLEKVDSTVCIQATKLSSDFRFYMEKRDFLIMRCELFFSGHLTKISDTLNDLEYLNNLKDFMYNSKMLHDTTDLSDFAICIDNETLPAHKLVLATHSPVFKKMITSDFLESKTSSITITDCDIDTFKCFLKYLYSGEITGDTSWSAMRKLYFLADKYDVATLKRITVDIMKSCISLDNIYDVLKFSYTYNDKDLQCAAKLFAGLHFQSLICEKEWNEFLTAFPMIGSDILANLCHMPIN